MMRAITAARCSSCGARPAFSEIYVGALKALHAEIGAALRPAGTRDERGARGAAQRARWWRVSARAG